LVSCERADTASSEADLVSSVFCSSRNCPLAGIGTAACASQRQGRSCLVARGNKSLIRKRRWSGIFHGYMLKISLLYEMKLLLPVQCLQHGPGAAGHRWLFSMQGWQGHPGTSPSAKP